jgi:hypothetical protein
MGARIANQLKVLNQEEAEKDLRHMEAYGAACITYAQQFFIHTNRELVQRGLYGPVAAHPSIGAANPTDSYNTHSSNPTITASNTAGVPHNFISMPIRIDPEEDKRLAILRKRVALSEWKREILETEYLSLRSHYVHEQHALRLTRLGVTGQIALWQEVIQRRGDLLAMKRVQVALVRDILQALEFRSKCLNSEISENTANASSAALEPCEKDIKSQDGDQSDTATPMDVDDTATVVDAVADSTTKGTASNYDNDDIKSETNKIPQDLSDIWSLIESRLQEAELACSEIDTPKELLTVKASLLASTSPELQTNSNGTIATSNTSSECTANPINNNRRSKSPTRGSKDNNANDDDHSVNSKTTTSATNATTKKNKHSKDSTNKCTTSTTVSTNSTSTIDAKKGSETENSPQHHQQHLIVVQAPKDEDSNTIPWKCQSMPRTPYDIPIYISPLSIVPDRVAGFQTSDVFGNSPTSVTWLDSNIPKFTSSSIPQSSPTISPSFTHANPDYDSNRVLQLRSQIESLTNELELESSLNQQLCNDIVKGRKRFDEVCVIMGMIRMEIESLLHRHNLILETPEARSNAVLLSNNKTDDDYIMGEDDEGFDEEEEEEGEIVDEDEEEDDDDSIKDKSDEGTLVDDEEVNTFSSDGPRDEGGDSDSEGENNGMESLGDGDAEEVDEEDAFEGEEKQPMKEVVISRVNSVKSNAENSGSMVRDETELDICLDSGVKRSFSDSGSGNNSRSDHEKKRRRL